MTVHRADFYLFPGVKMASFVLIMPCARVFKMLNSYPGISVIFNI